jgi:hypothetical protein
MTEVIPDLWYPGQPLEILPVTPTPAQFRTRFAEGVWGGQSEVVSLDGSLSALRPVDQPPTAIALLDMDDLIGNLGGSLRQLQHPENGTEIFTHDYGQDMFFHGDDNTMKHPLIRLVKNHEWPGVGMQPVQEIKAITDMVRSWRAAGVYVAVITSAIPGAELSHVDFMAKHFAGACDGMVITSGDYRLVDKGKAAAEIVDFVKAQPGTPVAHLDDLAHNTQKVRATLETHPSGVQVRSFQHYFPTGEHLGMDEGAWTGSTPLETFTLANDFLAEKLGRTLHVPLPNFMRTLRALASQGDRL